MTRSGPDHGASRVEDAYDWLLREITEFRLRSGTPLSENRLAAQLGISRTPVREALQRLEQEGLVQRSDTARFAVSMITAQELNDACDLLELLDTYLFSKAARALPAGKPGPHPTSSSTARSTRRRRTSSLPNWPSRPDDGCSGSGSARPYAPSA